MLLAGRAWALFAGEGSLSLPLRLSIRSRILLALLVVMVVALIVALPRSETTDAVAFLVDVVDGDTIWVRLADGREEKVRYIGLDAPETAHEGSRGEYLGEEATIHNAELLEGGSLVLETDVDDRDDFGRLLAYVWAGEVFVNERMILDGYARAHDYPPNLSRQDQLWEADARARAAGVGIWAEELEKK